MPLAIGLIEHHSTALRPGKLSAARGSAEGFDRTGQPRDLRLQPRRLAVLRMSPSQFSPTLARDDTAGDVAGACEGCCEM